MEELFAMFAVGFFWFAVVTIVRMSLEYGFRKRLLNKGSSPEEIKAMTQTIKPVDPYPNLKWGMILVGLGSAALIGDFIGREAVTAGLMLVFAGVGFLIYFMATKKFIDQK